MSVNISPVPRQQEVDSNGVPYAGAKLFTYAAGTTTKLSTFTSYTGLSANTNPIVLNASGRTPFGIWLTNGIAYDFILALSTDTNPPSSPIWTEPGIVVGVDLTSQWLEGLLTPTFINGTSFSLAGDQTVEFHVGRRVRANTSAGFIYGSILSSVFSGGITTVTLFNDSGALDGGLITVDLSLLTAVNVAFPRLNGSNNINDIVNGQFRIAQIGTSFIAVSSLAYDLDGWQNIKNTGAFTISQQTGSSTGKLARQMTVTTADASVGAGDLVAQFTQIEGYNSVKYINNTFTIGFWVRATVTGTHCVSVVGGTGSYILEYLVNVSNVWEYKYVTVIGGIPDLTGLANGTGMTIYWTNMAGTNYQAAKNIYQVGTNKYATSFQVNDMSSTSNIFSLQDVTLNLGSLPVQDAITYIDDISRAKRYFNKSFNLDVIPAQNAGAAGVVNFPSTKNGSVTATTQSIVYNTPMRTTPTITFYNPSNTNAQVRDNTIAGDCSATSTFLVGENGFTLQCLTNASTLVGNSLRVHWSANARLDGT